MDLNQAIRCANNLQDSEDTIYSELYYWEKLIEIFFPDRSILRPYVNDSIWQNLSKKYSYLTYEMLNNQNRKNEKMFLALSELMFLDQSLRKYPNSNIKDSLLRFYDKKTYDNLLALIKDSGFPSPKQLGQVAIYTHFLLLHGTVNFGISEDLDKILREQIVLGNYHPSMYARLIDRYRDWELKQPLIYGEWLTNDNQIGNIEDVKNVDKRRAEIGLETLYEFCMKNNLKLPAGYTIDKKYK